VPLLSQRYPAVYAARVAELRLERRVSDSLARQLFATTRSTSLLPVTVIRHQSLLRRRLGTTDPALLEGKITNLALAIPSVDGLLIRPGEMFSFWQRVGPPSAHRGFRPGLVLRSGMPASGTGGGLCQLANLLYWMALHTPLTVVERHHHSVDPFPDERRALPFGSGASVFYNYVDLRFRNDTDHAFQIGAWLTDRHLCGRILADRELDVAYHVYEVGHHFEVGPDGIQRCNEIWRRQVDRATGQTLDEACLMRNRSRVAYPVDPDRIGPSGAA
jgi:vancomycin resistance protein VanW